MKLRLVHFPGRFALDCSIYIGSWGIHATLAFASWSLLLTTPSLEVG